MRLAYGVRPRGGGPPTRYSPRRRIPQPRVAFLGTRGIPAQYGGFETAVERIAPRMADAGFDVSVYCRGRSAIQREHRGIAIIHLPAIRRRSLETISHTALSVLHCIVWLRPAVVFLFNSANSWFVPLLRACGIAVIIHPDGLEWRRAKWGWFGRSFYRLSERMAMRSSAEVIADARALSRYYMETFKRSSHVIAYGTDLVWPSDPRLLHPYGLIPREYHLVVARFEPENHVLEVVSAYMRSGARLPLVVVGGAPYGVQYSRLVVAAAKGSPDVRFLGSIWCPDVLDQLYANCAAYYHGHSVGGTNPSLLRAMGAGAVTVAHDNEFNREVLEDDAQYFGGEWELAGLFRWVEESPEEDRLRLASALRDRAAREYSWPAVGDAYVSLARSLVSLSQ